MKKPTLLLAVLLITTFGFAQNQTTFILLRHAEKANDGTRNPPLNEAGKERAEKLALLLENQEITAFYATPFIRTKDTLQPLAEKKGLEIIEYDPGDREEWLAQLYTKHPGGTVLIVGHSNTIPFLSNLLLGSEVFVEFEEKTEYSNLIVIVGSEIGNGKLVRLNF